ncbi:hypothetical protein BDR06DRAFT_976394 [Suillus hirtellus]|nr:hypothetical protein BDR06DRAFT_976394 [Suillus hirtellus]
MVQLYDIKKHQWYAHGCKHPTTKQSEQGGKSGTKDSEKLGEWRLIYKTIKTKLASGSLEDALLPASTSDASKSMLPFSNAELLTDKSEPDLEGSLLSDAVLEEGSLMIEQIFTSFSNFVAITLLTLKPNLSHPHNLLHTWSAANLSHPVPGDKVLCKPDLTLLDNVEARYHNLYVHLYDHSGSVTQKSCATFILHQNKTSPHCTQSESSPQNATSSHSSKASIPPHQMDLEMETTEGKSAEEDEADTSTEEDRDEVDK